MPSTPGVKAPLPGELLADLLALVGEINGVLDPDELLPAIARNLRRIVDFRILDIFLPDAEGFLAPAYVRATTSSSPRASDVTLIVVKVL